MSQPCCHQEPIPPGKTNPSPTLPYWWHRSQGRRLLHSQTADPAVTRSNIPSYPIAWEQKFKAVPSQTTKYSLSSPYRWITDAVAICVCYENTGHRDTESTVIMNCFKLPLDEKISKRNQLKQCNHCCICRCPAAQRRRGITRYLPGTIKPSLCPMARLSIYIYIYIYILPQQIPWCLLQSQIPDLAIFLINKDFNTALSWWPASHYVITKTHMG